MGSWTELDAIYPPGKLTPAAALVVALGHLEQARSLFQHGMIASFAPPQLAYDQDLVERIERYLGTISIEQFLSEACNLRRDQRLAIAVHLVDAMQYYPIPPIDRLDLLTEGLGITSEDIGLAPPDMIEFVRFAQ